MQRVRLKDVEKHRTSALRKQEDVLAAKTTQSTQPRDSNNATVKASVHQQGDAEIHETAQSARRRTAPAKREPGLEMWAWTEASPVDRSRRGDTKLAHSESQQRSVTGVCECTADLAHLRDVQVGELERQSRLSRALRLDPRPDLVIASCPSASRAARLPRTSRTFSPAGAGNGRIQC